MPKVKNLIFALMFFVSGQLMAESLSDDIASLKDNLKNLADPALVAQSQALLDLRTEDAKARAMLAQYALLQRQIELASWLFAEAAVLAPDDAGILSNLGHALTELQHTIAPKASDYSDLALKSLRRAVELMPDSAYIKNNLAYALITQAEKTEDKNLLTEIEKLLREAIKLDPETSLYHSHLAEVLNLLGQPEAAAKALKDAHRLNPYDGAYLMLRRKLADNAAAGGTALPSPDMSHCNFSYNCMQTCPGGIIGRLKVVNCEIDQQSAVLACQAGKPYTASYNCDIEIGNVPFLIPGLFPGMTVITPWGKVSVIVQGGGNVDFDLKVGVPGMPKGVDIQAGGRWNPKSGVSVTKFGPEISLSLYNGGKVLGPSLKEYGIPPGSA